MRNRTFRSGPFGLNRFGLSRFSLSSFGLADSVWAVLVTGHFGLVVSGWGHFGHDISVYKQLITLFIEIII